MVMAQEGVVEERSDVPFWDMSPPGAEIPVPGMLFRLVFVFMAFAFFLF